MCKDLPVRRLLRDREGFSLAELLVALVVSGLLVVGVTGGYILQKRTYEHEAHLRDLQLNGRIAMEQVARVVRNAGLGCREDLPPYGAESVCGFSNVFTAVNQTSGPDTLTVVTGLASRTRVVNPAYGSVFRLASVDGFAPGDHIFIAPWEYNRFQTILGISGQDVTVSTPLRAVFAGDKVFRVSAYTIELQGSKLLVRDRCAGEGEWSVADGIEDLQFRYCIDDGVGCECVDDGTGCTFVNDPTSEQEEMIRAVRIFLLVRSELPDPHYTDEAGTYTLADRTIVLDTNDANGIDSEFDHRYRRQVFVKTVMVRNRHL